MGILTHRATFGGNVEIRVDVALSPDAVDAGVWDTDRWDEALWSGHDPQWQPITGDILSVDLSRGRERWLDRFTPPTARVVVDNTSGRYSPLGGETLPADDVRLRPGRWLRIAGRVEGIDTGQAWEPMFIGRLEELRDRYDAGGYQIITDMYCTGLSAAMAMINPPPLGTPRPVELTAERLEYLFDAARVWEHDIRIPSGFPLKATDFPNDYWTETQIAVASYANVVFETRSGVVTALQRSWPWDPTIWPDALTPQFTAGGADVGVIAVEVEWSLGQVYNDVRLESRDGANSARSQSSASQTLYGHRTYSDSALDNNAGTFQATSDFILEAKQWDKAQMVAVDVVAVTDTGAAALIMAEALQLIAVVTQTKGNAPGGWDWWVPTHIQRVTHSITADDWNVRLALDDAGLSGISPPKVPAGSYVHRYRLRRGDTDVQPGHIGTGGAPETTLVVHTTDADGLDATTMLEDTGLVWVSLSVWDGSLGTGGAAATPGAPLAAPGWAQYEVLGRVTGTNEVTFTVDWVPPVALTGDLDLALIMSPTQPTF